ncbi:MAG: hypothetical protein ABL934_11995 [Lysobacteraceae bacterium]
MSERVPVQTAPVPKQVRCFRFLKAVLALAALHIAITVQLFPVIGFFAAIYAAFPPIIFFIAYDTAAASPLFASIALGVSSLAWLGLRGALSGSVARLPHAAKWLVWATLAIWIPVACGEGVRWSLMQIRIANATPHCHETSTLLAALQRRNTFGHDELREPHAWMVSNGEVWLWSYRSLRFEAAPDWYRASSLIEDCKRSAQ